jgi:hypothetical protein
MGSPEKMVEEHPKNLSSEDAYDSQGHLKQQAHHVIGCMEGSMALL